MAGEKKDLAYFRALPYRRRVHLIEEDTGEAYFVAEVVELPGVEADGAYPHEAFYNLQQAFEDYLAAMLKWGEVIPEPVAKAIRVPKKAKKNMALSELKDEPTATFRVGEDKPPLWEVAQLQTA